MCIAVIAWLAVGAAALLAAPGRALAVPGPLPDLIISEFSVTPNWSELGTELTFTVRGRNVGADATGDLNMGIKTNAPPYYYTSSWSVAGGLAAGAQTAPKAVTYTPLEPGTFTAEAWIELGSGD